MKKLSVLAVWCFAFAQLALPATWYVATNGTGNGTSWASATNSIQGAIDAATVSDTVLVSNGVYEVGGVTNFPAGSLLTNRVAIYKAIIVRSANNDPSNTVIKGTRPSGAAAVRCVSMTNGSSLIGFMLTNGATFEAGVDNSYGGGIWCQSANTVISNCVIVGNTSGGVWSGGWGGGVYQGTLYNCTLTGNSAHYGGGAKNSTMYNCNLIGNPSGYRGGGAHVGTLYNCLIVGNSAEDGGGAYSVNMYNCTIVSNAATTQGGGMTGGILYNCISWNNSMTDVLGTAYFSCGVGYTNGGSVSGNITNDPMFVNSAGDYRLSDHSPCINSGTNMNWMTNSFDLDGRKRIFEGIVDMGAYEFIHRGIKVMIW